MTLKVTVDLSGLEQRFSGESLTNARKLLAERCKNDCYYIVPKDTGALRDSALVAEDGSFIEWTEDYAQHVYNMDEQSAWTTQGTSSHWFEHAKQEKVNEWVEYTKEVVLA